SDYAHEELEYLSDKSNLIRVYPNELNDRIDGGLIPGNSVLVFARPNTGKTQFAINLTRGFIRDGRRVLYLINEEPKRQLLSRMISRLTNKVRTEIYSDVDAAVKEAKKNGLDNFFLEDINPGTFPQIRGLIEKVKPEILVIDQLRNLDVKSDTRVNQLETAATEARNLAKRYGIVVISMTQAGDSAHNKLALEMNDVDFSNTGIPAQMDLMIGIGINQQFRDQNMRMISIAKNKITSDHSHFPVAVDEALSKMVSV
ncbi:MAG: AAA family ATPase, partial [Candidatus Peribacteraceae bacterium]|nr:AAA family ATPase [Candidatus Peribacteraceae bacterium]